MRLTRILGIVLAAHGVAVSAQPLDLVTQRRVTDPNSPHDIRIQREAVQWDPNQTAIVVCDMWDRHWCRGATGRVGELAPVMETVLQRARDRGVLIIHAPSSTISFYEDTPQRAKAKNAPHAEMPNPDGWKHLNPDREAPLPIDDSDGGCDCDPQCPDVNQRYWSRQIDVLSIGPDDAITDDGQEVYNLLEAEGRENVIVMGVHTNMCVLGRPFSIRANVMNGKNTVLMRDLTDTMYNSRMAPYVDHHRGTDLVVGHIEKYWAATITSTSFTGEAPFRFDKDKRRHAVFLLAEDEYETEYTLSSFAETELADAFGWRCTYLTADGPNSIAGLEALDDADVMIVSVRRKVLPAGQLARVRAFVESGRPVVGIRTASHAFHLRSLEVGDGRDQWPEFDPEVLGGHYRGHTNNKEPRSPRTYVWVKPDIVDHPVVQGVHREPFVTPSWLYQVSPLEESAVPVMMGRVEGYDQDEPVAWTNVSGFGNRVFYTSLGHPEDFGNPNFRRLLLNGILWTLNLTAGAAEEPAAAGAGG